jgi:hypothetical protein
VTIHKTAAPGEDTAPQAALPLIAALVRFSVLAGRRTMRPVEDLITRDAVMPACEAAWLVLFCVGLYVG